MIQPHRTLITGLVCAMRWLLAPLGAAAPTVRLSLSQALAQARQRNPGVAVAQARVSVAEGMKTQAGLIPNPVLTMTSENSPLGSQPFQFSRDTDDYAFLTQTIELGGKRSRRVKLENEKVRQTALEGE